MLVGDSHLKMFIHVIMQILNYVKGNSENF